MYRTYIIEPAKKCNYLLIYVLIVFTELVDLTKGYCLHLCWALFYTRYYSKLIFHYF